MELVNDAACNPEPLKGGESFKLKANLLSPEEQLQMNCDVTQKEVMSSPEEVVPKKHSRHVHFEVVYVVLCVVILLEWAVLSLPIIFYHLPLTQATLTNVTVIRNDSNQQCFPYPTTSSGGECRAHLTNTLLSLNCDPGETPLVLRDEENTASELLPLLNLLRPSAACTEAVVPFLCVFLFGLCDSSGVSIQPTSVQCEQIRDVLCPDQWRQAALVVDLPECSSFPAEQAPCPVASGSGLDQSGFPTLLQPEETSFPCSDGFYREEVSGFCLPSCHNWIQFPKSATIAVDVIIVTAAIIGLITAMAVLVSSCIKRKRMFAFPSVLIVYKTVDVLVLAIFVLVNYTDRPSLFCSSINLFNSLQEVTPFCVISGMVFVYILMQLTIWWVLHTAVFFWKVQFPFHSHQSFQEPRRVKCIHITCVTVGLLFPLVPIIASVADSAADWRSDTSRNVSFLKSGLGFGQTRFPAILCTSTDEDVTFYSFVLPINLILAIGCSLLTVVFWTLHKRGLFQAKLLKRRPTKVATSAERRLLIVVVYYVLLAAIALTAFTLNARYLPQEAAAILSYFSCEQGGYNPEAPCSRSGFEGLANPGLSTLAYILVALFPIVNLVYTLNIEEIKKCCRICKVKARYTITERIKLHS